MKKLSENLARMQTEKTVLGKILLTHRLTADEPWDDFFFVATRVGRLVARQPSLYLEGSQDERRVLAHIGSVFAKATVTGGASKIREIADAFEAWHKHQKGPDLFRLTLLWAYITAGGSTDGKKLVTLKPGELLDDLKTNGCTVNENTMRKVRKARDKLGINLRFGRGSPKAPNATMMHGSDFAGQDPAGWIVTEKFDGFFARWTGQTLLTREGHDYNAPEWFTHGLPRFALDCEVFAGYGRREFLNSAHRWRDKGRWRQVELIAFDAPAACGGYAARHSAITVRERPGLRVAARWTCAGKPGLVEALAAVKAKGGEGLVIRHPEAPYQVGRVQTMLKVKPEFIRR